MITELRTFQIKCDGNQCNHASTIVIQSRYPTLPEGWEARTVGDCGATGYNKTIHLCGYCVQYGDR